jgi:RNase P protein component
MGAGWDLLVIMKPDARSATYDELGAALDAALSRAGVAAE